MRSTACFLILLGGFSVIAQQRIFGNDRIGVPVSVDQRPGAGVRTLRSSELGARSSAPMRRSVVNNQMPTREVLPVAKRNPARCALGELRALRKCGRQFHQCLPDGVYIQRSCREGYIFDVGTRRCQQVSHVTGCTTDPIGGTLVMVDSRRGAAKSLAPRTAAGKTSMTVSKPGQVVVRSGSMTSVPVSMAEMAVEGVEVELPLSVSVLEDGEIAIEKLPPAVVEEAGVVIPKPKLLAISGGYDAFDTPRRPPFFELKTDPFVHDVLPQQWPADHVFHAWNTAPNIADPFLSSMKSRRSSSQTIFTDPRTPEHGIFDQFSVISNQPNVPSEVATSFRKDEEVESTTGFSAVTIEEEETTKVAPVEQKDAAVTVTSEELWKSLTSISQEQSSPDTSSVNAALPKDPSDKDVATVPKQSGGKDADGVMDKEMNGLEKTIGNELRKEIEDYNGISDLDLSKLDLDPLTRLGIPRSMRYGDQDAQQNSTMRKTKREALDGDVSADPSVCADGDIIGSPTDPGMFYKCVQGKMMSLKCPPSMIFSSFSNECTPHLSVPVDTSADGLK